jgi:hypothetical protein
MVIKERKEKALQKCVEIHGNKFNYSKFTYVNAKTKSIIICPEHGEFEQCLDKHFNSKHGCPICANKARHLNRTYKPKPYKYTKEEALSLLNEKHPKYLFSIGEYTGGTSRVTIVCEKHGETESNLRTLLRPSAVHVCRNCAILARNNSKTKSFSDFIKEATQIHNNLYTYECNAFQNRRSKITCVCPIHGIFIKTAQKILSGQGCPSCTFDRLKKEGKLLGGYNDSLFINNPHMRYRKSYIYYVKIGNMYKIGITTNIDNRLKSLRSKFNKSIEVIDVKELPLYLSYRKEQEILLKYENFRVFTKKSTELFKKDVLNSSIPK